MAHSTLQLVLRHAGALASEADATPDAELLRRFAGGDEAAFAELVRRHGPVVWAACRHLLPTPADAEDAFQVAFLALARSARSIRHEAAVGGWLHGVAVRAALRLRRDAARRRAREQRASVVEADRSVPEHTWDALLAAVHEEVGRLPGPLRTAFVLCDLEGVRQPDAAARLGWKPGTLTGRLTRARQQLIARLTGRGLAPGAAGAVGLGVATAAAAVPAEVVGRVVALSRAGGVVPSALSELVREVTPMAVNWWAKRLAAAVVVAGGLGAVVFPMARAQQPGGGDPFGRPQPGGAPDGGSSLGPRGSGGPGMVGPGGSGGGPAFASPRAGWEYKYLEQRPDAEMIKKRVSELGAEGWEYCDHFRFDQHAGLRPDQPMFLLVFKRPAGGGVTRGAGGGGMMMVPGFGGGEGGIGAPGTGGALRLGPGSSSGGTGSGSGGSPPGATPGKGGSGGATNPLGGGGGAGKAGGDVLILPAKHADAAELAKVLREVYSRDTVEFAVDDRTNTLIVRGDARFLPSVRALVTQLDATGRDPRGANPKR